jgi:hypothetical protein
MYAPAITKGICRLRWDGNSRAERNSPITLCEIGARQGVSRSAAYRHFKNKAGLLSAISEAGFLNLEAT